MTADPQDQRYLTDAVIGMLEERAGQLNDIARVPDDVLRLDPLVTGIVLHSEEGRDYTLSIQDVETSPVTQRVHAASPEPEQDVLMEAARQLADLASGEFDADEYPAGPPSWDVWDGNRSSIGQEYLLAPDAAGWHTLLKNGRVIECSIRFADADTAHLVRMEMDEQYALAHADDDLDDEIPGSCDITGDQ
jgi:hypothetical protein